MALSRKGLQHLRLTQQRNCRLIRQRDLNDRFASAGRPIHKVHDCFTSWSGCSQVDHWNGLFNATPPQRFPVCPARPFDLYYRCARNLRCPSQLTGSANRSPRYARPQPVRSPTRQHAADLRTCRGQQPSRHLVARHCNIGRHSHWDTSVAQLPENVVCHRKRRHHATSYLSLYRASRNSMTRSTTSCTTSANGRAALTTATLGILAN